MSEGKQYIPDQFAGREFKAASVTQAKVSTKLYKTSSSDPAATDDTGLGYAAGTIWTNTTSGQVFICTVDTAEDATWVGQEGDTINEPFTIGASNVWYSGGMRDGAGRPGGGDYSAEEVNSFPVTSSGNATDIGETDTTTHTSGPTSAIHDDSFVYLAGGNAANHPTSNAAGAYTSEINRSAMASPVSFTDIGDLDAGTTAEAAGGTDGVSGWVAGGRQPSSITQIDKFSLASPSTTSDTGGDLTAANNRLGGHSDCLNSKIFVSGGYAPSRVDTIESFPMTITTGTSSDYGELSVAKAKQGSIASTTHAFTIGGDAPGATNLMEKFPFTAPTSNTDIGELISAKYEVRGMGSPDSTAAGFCMGGKTAAADTIDEIDKFSLSSPGNASDWGNLIEKPASGYASGV